MKEQKKDDMLFLVPEPRQRSSRASFLWLLLFIGFVLCTLSFATLYYRSHYLLFLRNKLGNKCNNNPVCTGISDLGKFDCHPDDGASKSNCLQRGCCYQAGVTRKGNNLPPLNVPYCFYSSNYLGYSIGGIKQNGRQIQADLKRIIPSGFPNDIQNLQFVLTFIDDSTIRIKITDAKASRFEVPIPINADLKNLQNPIYEVKLDSKTGVLSINRKATGTVVFNTNLSRLVYSDQFLQLSSNLPSPYLYGVGEHYGSFLRDVNWTRITLFNNDRGPVPNNPLYGSHPFYLSLEKDGNSNGVFLLNSNAMDVILQPTPAITFRPIGGIFDFFLMLGPTPANVVQQYTDIIGRTFMPPYWSLGFHLCRYGYDSLNTTKETMQRNIDAGIPIDVQWNDIDYMDAYKDFTYDKQNFAGLPDFVDELHNKGMRYVLMTDPGISNSEKAGTYPPFDEGLKEDIFIKNPNGSIFVGKVWTNGETVYPDFTHPNASSFWIKQFKDFHAKIKFDGVWIDMNEPSNFYNGGKDGCMKSSFEDPVYLPGGDLPLRRKTVCMTAKHYSTIHYNEHNLYAHREATATNQALKSIRKKRPFIISRASYAGQGVQSGHWSGDISSSWNDMRYTIPSMLNFNLYGMSMIGSDICGFGSNTTVPLCARWQTLGAFYPFSRNHNDRASIDQDPVALGPVVVEAAKKALETRYQLLPYLYTLFYRSHVYGDTVVRPLFFEFPLDNSTYPIDEQFLWGPALMIIPALYPNITEVNAYLPNGVWYDSLGLPQNSKGENISIPLGLTDIGLVMRGGYILPAQINGKTTNESRKNPFVLLGGLDENKLASGELYWDDGDSLDTFEKKSYTLIKFSANQNSLNTTVVHKGYNDDMELGEINFAGLDKEPTQVSINGVKCSKQVIKTKEKGMNMFGAHKIDDYLADSTVKDTYCVFQFHPPCGLALGIKNLDLLSPVSIVWN